MKDRSVTSKAEVSYLNTLATSFNQLNLTHAHEYCFKMPKKLIMSLFHVTVITK